ncbi:phosphatase PAP2 family protein [Cryobacterium melibiosiphilum]|uniref:Phosphatase PAP2 family protein n=1 Tax=Cryobacterium melibiosiphilum TaxID=995039 RepID=A0A3A5MGQ3_9MICO|nr:phosphatase PAP2 family protein [Cryobacterium melibiosiphilum]RJT89340.1 phosphatase PAP2 family protein [Cryobacterium melibiosiphilum]
MRTTSSARPLAYLGGAVLLAVVFAALYVVFVRTITGQVADQLSYDGAENGWRSVTPFTRRLLDAVPMVSVVIGLVLTGIITLVRRNWATLIVALAAAGAATVSAQILKYVILDRPDLDVIGYAGNSFPSGHTTVAAASALVVFLVASPRTRPIIAAAGTSFAIAAGVATLANQWHRPSDVVAALLVVAFWGCLAGVVLSVRARAAHAVASVGTRARAPRWWLWLVPIVGLTGLSLAVTVLRASADSPGMLVAYVGGVVGIVGVGLVLAFAGTRLFARLP